jgi:hypothetical protein
VTVTKQQATDSGKPNKEKASSTRKTGTSAARGGSGSDTGRNVGTAASSRRILGYRRQRFEARKVRRLVRHVDPWSVLKLSLLLALCMWVVALIASVIIWSVANNTGALDSLERFFQENLRLTDFELTGGVLFRQFGLISLLASLGFAASMVIISLVFNLVSDIIGGVWISVIEEETARPIVDVVSGEQASASAGADRSKSRG